MSKEIIIKPLTDLKSGQEGIIKSVQGGHGAVRRLEAMGIRPGIKIRKSSAQFMRGPIGVKAGNTSLALGYGMAQKIMVAVPAGRQEVNK